MQAAIRTSKVYLCAGDVHGGRSWPRWKGWSLMNQSKQEFPSVSNSCSTVLQVGVMHAFCPHMGAHLGMGGVVVGNLLQCPFHGWSFDTSGADELHLEVNCSFALSTWCIQRSRKTIEKNDVPKGVTFSFSFPTCKRMKGSRSHVVRTRIGRRMSARPLPSLQPRDARVLQVEGL